MIRAYTIFFALLAAFFTLVVSQRDVRGRSMDIDDRGSAAIKFSHKFHIEEAAASDCMLCHEEAFSSAVSSDNLLAPKASCAACHDVEDPDLCIQCHTSDASYGPYPPSDRELVFSHASHQGVDCSECHTGIALAENSANSKLPTMATCNTCHDDRKVSNTCESCHTNFTSLVPEDHLVAEFSRNHRFSSRVGALNASCQTCHQETFCQDCHTDGGVRSFGRGDLAVDPRPKLSTSDSPDRTVLQSVHSLNYRFTHGIDARSRAMDCASCHETQSFCVTCHEAGGNITQEVFRPRSHDQAGFATFGRGSGGGLHALEAKRDMESCISCHDVEGRDPSCFSCHSESGLIR